MKHIVTNSISLTLGLLVGLNLALEHCVLNITQFYQCDSPQQCKRGVKTRVRDRVCFCMVIVQRLAGTSSATLISDYKQKVLTVN